MQESRIDISTYYQDQENNQQIEQAKREVIPWVVWLARFGYAAKGVVYFTIGILALQLALGSGGKATGPSGALKSLFNQPFGNVLLAVMAGGLFAYAIWRFVQAWVDPDNAGSDLTGIVKRVGYVTSGILYGVFGYTALEILFGTGVQDGDTKVEQYIAWLMRQPFGPWIVGAIGVILIGTGFYQFYRSLSASFKDKLKLESMNETEERWVTVAGRLGFAARGVVYVLLGAFLVAAAVQYDPQKAMGIGEALLVLLQQPYGSWLLGAVAVGLMVYGVYALVLARYRRIFLT